MNYPLFLTYKGAVFGNGFAAQITAVGRLLASLEAEGCWLYGVNPGAIAADGRTLEDAHASMREALRLVFVDFASESKTFEEFKAKAEEFFNAEDQVSEWEQAVLEHRKNKTDSLGLPKRSADSTEHGIIIVRAKDFTPAMNVPAMNYPAPDGGEPPLAKAA